MPTVTVPQYASIKSDLEQTIDPQEWLVIQRSFITGTWSLNKKDLHENLHYFKVLQEDIESIRSKLTFKIFDEYANILKGMFSTRFNGCPKDSDSPVQEDWVPCGSIPPLRHHLPPILNLLFRGFYCHSRINVDQSNRIFNLKSFLVVMCGQFHCKWGTGGDLLIVSYYLYVLCVMYYFIVWRPHVMQ